MENKQATVRINCNLEGETASRFLKIKQKKGLKQNTEAVRLAVNSYFESEIVEE